MGWETSAVCVDCYQLIHGPGTGPSGPRPGHAICGRDYFDESDRRTPIGTPNCAFCRTIASPAVWLKLWAAES